MGHLQQRNRLAKVLSYVLGCRPDEFGLIPDCNGFIKIKTLLQALSEETGWRHVRRAHLNELTISLPKCPVEIVGQEIRAVDRSRLRSASADTPAPKLLYTCVRQKAYPHAMEKGIPKRGTPLILCTQKEMAGRIGRRQDHNAVLLTVNTSEALAKGVTFAPSGEGLFLAGHLPPGCFSGPPLPKTAPPKKKARPEAPAKPQTPGSFFIDLEDATPETRKWDPKRKDKARKDKAWKKERRRRQSNQGNKWP
jgi:putative RNA 2'-phosphotransferase